MRAILNDNRLVIYNDNFTAGFYVPFTGRASGAVSIFYDIVEVTMPPDDDDIRRRFEAETIVSLYIGGQLIHRETHILHHDDNVFDYCPCCGWYHRGDHIPIPFDFELIAFDTNTMLTICQPRD